jgi:putative phosphoesterase
VRVAALYDIHANLPAFDAVIAAVDREDPDLIVIGGDVASGPLPVETIERLRSLAGPVRYVMGNTDQYMIDAFDEGVEADASAEGWERVDRWAAGLLSDVDRGFLAAFEPSVRIEVQGLGPILFCHGSPRADEDRITMLTSEPRLAEMLAATPEEVVVCGHTHHQFDRRIGGHRVVNAGSVGMPYEGEAAAFWLSLGPEVELRRTDYDVPAAVAQLRATRMPEIDELMLRESLIEPISPKDAAEYFERKSNGS